MKLVEGNGSVPRTLEDDGGLALALAGLIVVKLDLAQRTDAGLE